MKKKRERKTEEKKYLSVFSEREREREREPGTQRLLLFFSFSDFFPLLLPSRIACGVLWLFDDVCKLGIPDGFYSDEWTTRSCAPRASA